MPKTPSLLDLIGLLPSRDIARAAKAVGLTPDTLISRVASLESVIGAKLVDTAAKPLKPGEAGRLVIDHASRIFSQARDFTRDLEALAGLQAPELNFGTDMFAAELPCPPHRARWRSPRTDGPLIMQPIERVNDFVVKFANVNGSGSASANNLFAKAVLRMGVPVAARNIFPSNIQGMPTWYEVRVVEAGWRGRRGGVDLMVAMNAETWSADVAEVEQGGYLFYASTKPLPHSRLREDITPVGMPLPASARRCTRTRGSGSCSRTSCTWAGLRPCSTWRPASSRLCSPMTRRQINYIAVAAFPYFLMMVIAVLAIRFFPALVTFLPGQMKL